MSKKINKYKHPDDEEKLIAQLEEAGWRVGSVHDDDAHLVRCGDLIRPRDDAAARALFNAQLGAPPDIRGEPPKDVWWIHVDQFLGGEYYFPEKPRNRAGQAPKTFPIERTFFGDGFWVEHSVVEPRGVGWVAAADGNNIWLRRRRVSFDPLSRLSRGVY